MYRVVFWRIAVNNLIDREMERRQAKAPEGSRAEQTDVCSDTPCECTETSTCLDCFVF